MKLLVALAVIVTLLAACGGDASPTATPSGPGAQPTATERPAPEGTELDGTAWLLAGIDGADIDLQTPLTLTFADGRASGYSGCNDFGGAYSATDDGVFSLPEIEVTDMDCEIGMDLEHDYLATLARAAQYALIGKSRLELHSASGETLLVFTSDSREALDGTSWTLVTIDGDAPLAGTSPTLALRAGEASGSTGCNQFGGMYTAADAGALTFNDLFWTERGCIEPNGVMEQEQAFLDALQQAATWERDSPNGRLLILDAGGQTRLIFAAAELETEARLRALHGADRIALITFARKPG